MNLERSTLERKDRAELATIAETLGRKPSSRARKSDLIDLILELTGVTGAPASATQPVAAEDPAGSEPAEPDTAGSADDDHGADPRGNVASAAGANDTGRGDNDNGRGDGTTDRAGDDSDDGEHGANNDAERAVDGAADGGGAHGGDADGGDSEQTEGGRRQRRRRRGRDRQGSGGDVQEEPTTPWEGEPIEVSGTLDLRDEGYGFLRVNGFLPGRDDVYVSVKQCRGLGLRRGDEISGACRPAGRQERNPALIRVDAVNGVDPELARQRRHFDDLTPVFPTELLSLEVAGESGESAESGGACARIIDLIAPIARGQRGLVLAPAGTDRSAVLAGIARGVAHHHDDVELVMLVVDERPEEITHLNRSLETPVIASGLDRPAEEHVAAVELTFEQAKRAVEDGRDVVVLLDGLTRLAHALNVVAAGSGNGKVPAAALDSAAIAGIKRIFGAARRLEEGGSLTVVATVDTETGSPIDELILDAIRDAANMELCLDGVLARKGLNPPVDVTRSWTRHEELFLDAAALEQRTALRRLLADLAIDNGAAAGERLLELLAANPDNAALLAAVTK
jgi:transcription termination factor Rho